jgi:hypothetical protein
VSESSLRRCSRCRQFKPVDDFATRRRRTGDRDTYCRPCRSAYGKEHYAKNRQRYIDQAVKQKDALRRERVLFLLSYFDEHPCVDCGERDPVVLEFDHIGDDKAFNIAQGLLHRKFETLLTEIAKCEVVCANCHRRRTARRGGHRRLSLSSERAGDRTRTGTESLEGSCAAVTPHPREP